MSNKIRRYKLLKDLPFAKAGEIFKGELEYGTTILFPEDYENYKHKLSSDEFWDFDEWFEEIKEPKRIYYANDFGCNVANMTENNNSIIRKNLKSVGNHFETYEETKAYLEYLKAKAIIKQDTKGFKPDWNNENKIKYSAHWNNKANRSYVCRNTDIKNTTIYFETEEDIKESLEKHPNEWKTYLTYEQ